MCVLCSEYISITNTNHFSDYTRVNSANTLSVYNYIGMKEGEWNSPKCLTINYNYRYYCYYYYYYYITSYYLSCYSY